MIKNHTAMRRITALLLAILTLLSAFSLASCNTGGSDKIYTQDELRENIESDSYSGYDYVWQYLNRWKFPSFIYTKVRSAEYLVKRNFYKELPEARTLAENTAETFLNSYYSNIDLEDEGAVTDAILSSYVASLDDKYAIYRTPEEYDNYHSDSTGTLVGIGVSVSAVEGVSGIYVNFAYDGSPADAAGILPGDIIVAVDGTRVENMDFTAATDMVRGEVGTRVEITVKRDDGEHTFNITRAMIDEKTVQYSIDDGIGYIRITDFKLNTAEQFCDAVDYMKSNNITAVIYDLRANLGGYLSAVVDMLEYLAPRGTTLVSFSNGDSQIVDETEHSYTPTAIVLTDYNTASAAELFTAGVCDLADMGYGTALTVGKGTRGKGVMQSTYNFNDGASITFTIAYYNPPSGVNFHDVGIPADVEVEYTGVGDTQLDRAYEEINKLINTNT